MKVSGSFQAALNQAFSATELRLCQLERSFCLSGLCLGDLHTRKRLLMTFDKLTVAKLDKGIACFNNITVLNKYIGDGAGHFRVDFSLISCADPTCYALLQGKTAKLGSYRFNCG